MEISSFNSAVQPLTTGVQAGDDVQLAKSCHEFEANLWRQVLDRALSPLLSSSKEGQAPGAGVYTYFLSSTIADRVSGGSAGFSNLLQAQLSAQKTPNTSSSASVCTKAATH